MDVRRATATDVPRLAEMLAAAFRDYPWTRWTFDEDDHERRLGRMYELMLTEFAPPHGEVWIADECDAAAVWAWTGLGRSADDVAALHRVNDEMRTLAGGRAEAGAIAEGLISAHRPDGEHWYLASLGVRPSCQGRGLGSRVVEPMLNRLDAEGQTAALDTSSADSVRFCSRHGFEVVDQFELPDAGPTIWIMVRRPR